MNTDGSYDYYADYDAFAAAHPEAVGDSLESYVGQDLNLEKVLCTFGVDDQGRLIEIQGTGEGRPFTLEEQQKLVELCAKGIRELQAAQKKALG